MSYKVHIDSYSGPFDLLLYLVSRQKVDIGVISITSIIDQYLEEMEHIGDVELRQASSFRESFTASRNSRRHFR